MLKKLFAAGSVVVISPIGELPYKSKLVQVADAAASDLSERSRPFRMARWDMNETE